MESGKTAACDKEAWQLLGINAAAAAVDALSACFEQHGACSITLSGHDPDEQLIGGAAGEQIWRDTTVTAMFAADVPVLPILRAAQRVLGSADLPPHTLRPLEARDWRALAETGFPAMCFGDRLWVRPSWAPKPSTRK